MIPMTAMASLGVFVIAIIASWTSIDTNTRENTKQRMIFFFVIVAAMLAFSLGYQWGAENADA